MLHSQILFNDPDCTHIHTIYVIIYGIQGCEQSGARYVDKSTVRDCRNSLNQIVQLLWVRMITYAKRKIIFHVWIMFTGTNNVIHMVVFLIWKRLFLPL